MASSLLLGANLVGCIDSGQPELDGMENVVSQDFLDSGSFVPLPAGFGHYCSVLLPDDTYQFATSAGNGDPCGDLLRSAPAGTVVTRAGIYDMNGYNNAMLKCTDGAGIQLNQGASAATALFQWDTVHHTPNNGGHCALWLSPVNLPIWSNLWAYDWIGSVPLYNDVPLPSTFNFDVYGPYMASVLNSPVGKWNPQSTFGTASNPANDPHALTGLAFDRYGNEQMYAGSAAQCNDPVYFPSGGCPVFSPGGHSFEVAYDWTLTFGRGLLAVAPGRIIGAQDRDLGPRTGSPGQTPCEARYQREISLLTQVDTGWYAEQFVAVYHHMDGVNAISAATPGCLGTMPVSVGQQVSRGQVIANVGNSGSSGGAHLDLQVIRLTNTTGAFWYDFATQAGGYGYNGIQAAIDPYGWAGPGIDPFAYKFIGFPFLTTLDLPYGLQTPGNLNGAINSAQGIDASHPYGDPGAFSVNLWMPGSAPVNR